MPVEVIVADTDPWKALQLTEEEGEARQRLIERRLGIVLGREGGGGSGVFITDQYGRVGLLTARHVVVPAAISGEVTVLPCGLVPTRSRPVTSIWVEPCSDIAFCVLEPDEGYDPIAIDAWNRAVASSGDLAVGSGAPGEWKLGVDRDARTIETTKVLHFWAGVLPGLRSGLVPLDVDESNPALPSSFAGMSGGPVFDRAGMLTGVLTAEIRRMSASNGQLLYTPIAEASSIFDPFVQPDSWPTDMCCRQAPFTAQAFYLCKDGQHVDVQVTVRAERWRSAATPEAKGGRVGRICGVKLHSAACPEGVPINVEYVFDYYTDDDDDWVELLGLDAWTILNAWNIFARCR